MFLQMARFHSFLGLSNITPYTHTHTHTHTRRNTHTHIFIHLSVEGHLNRFHILAIVNNASVNIGIDISFQIGAFVFFR